MCSFEIKFTFYLEHHGLSSLSFIKDQISGEQYQVIEDVDPLVSHNCSVRETGIRGSALLIIVYINSLCYIVSGFERG